MDRMRCESTDLQIFFCKNISLRRYGSFNDLVELYFLELLMSVEKLEVHKVHPHYSWQSKRVAFYSQVPIHWALAVTISGQGCLKKKIPQNQLIAIPLHVPNTQTVGKQYLVR